MALSYGIGGPVGAILEYRASILSERFELPAGLIYLAMAIQLACVPLLFSKRHARIAAVALSATTIGAAISHLRIGSPLTAIPALLYTVVQLWFAARHRAVDMRSAT